MRYFYYKRNKLNSMRLIKFRAILSPVVTSNTSLYDFLTREWTYGYLIKYGNNTFISPNSLLPSCKLVLSETVGQFTGIYDKTEKELYEGDIFKEIHTGTIRTVFYKDGSFVFEGVPEKWGYGKDPYHPFDQQNSSWFNSNCEIIGNIHENSDLLKKINIKNL